MHGRTPSLLVFIYAFRPYLSISDFAGFNCPAMRKVALPGDWSHTALLMEETGISFDQAHL
jgi:hypothetical protein